MAKIIRFAVGQAKKAGRKARAKKQLKETRKDLKENPGPKLEQKPAPKSDGFSEEQMAQMMEEETHMARLNKSDKATQNRILDDGFDGGHGLDKVTRQRIKTSVSESEKGIANKRLPTEHKFALRSDKPKKISTKTKVLKLKAKKK